MSQAQSRAISSGLCLCLGVMLSPAVAFASQDPPPFLPYDQGDPVPPGYIVQKERRTGLMIAGGITFFAAYGSVYAVAAINNGRNAVNGELELTYYPLYIPFAGPFIGLATVEPNTPETLALVASGVVQAAGATIFFVGLVTHDLRLMRVSDDVVLDLRLSPSTLGLTGTF
jgi:hypothetical protein